MAVNSSDLKPSETWVHMAAEIQKDYEGGMPFEDSLMMNVAIKMRDPLPYIRHRERLDEVLWFDDPAPKTIIEVGPGYGAMLPNWPAGSTVYHVDLPVMLAIQSEWAVSDRSRIAHLKSLEFVNINDVDRRVPFDGAYLFSVWALTETTMPTWQYYIEKAPRLAGAYVLGHARWGDEQQPWPWGPLSKQFKTTRKLRAVHPDSIEFAGVNR